MALRTVRKGCTIACAGTQIGDLPALPCAVP
jgi:hypothetical protein